VVRKRSQPSETSPSAVLRCPWAKGEQSIAYHDEEWGVPCHDDRTLFEFLILEGAQAGLSWDTVLKKREHYRAALDGFSPERIVRYTPARLNKLLENPGLVRNRLKIASLVRNAAGFLRIQDEYGSFDSYLWKFVEGRPRLHQRRSPKEIPTRTLESDALSKDLKRRGFNFVGSTICYAYMQAMGLVNDHLVDCFRHSEVHQQ